MKKAAFFFTLVLVAGTAAAFRAVRSTEAESQPEAAAVEAPEATAKVAEESCGRCPNISVQHYRAKGCSPIIDPSVDKCCPALWHCPTEEERGILLTQCFYLNKTYEIGQSVPVVGSCRRGCECKKSVDPEEPAKIECGIVECPSSYNPPKPGCRSIFHQDECCEVDLECSEIVSEAEVVNANLTIRSGDCFAEGEQYFIGDKIVFDSAPCQECVCTDQFSGAFGPGCVHKDCGIEYRDRHYLRKGCTPLYYNGTCCHTDWICPESPQVIYDESRQAAGEIDKKTQCSLGKTVASKGEALHMYDCHISCHCVTPPDFTCVQYSSCSLALAAVNAGESP